MLGGEKRGFAFEGQKHQGEKKNEDKPGHGQAAVSHTEWESRDVSGATEDPRKASWKI